MDAARFRLVFPNNYTTTERYDEASAVREIAQWDERGVPVRCVPA